MGRHCDPLLFHGLRYVSAAYHDDTITFEPFEAVQRLCLLLLTKAPKLNKVGESRKIEFGHISI
jgi:hypothetical protein